MQNLVDVVTAGNALVLRTGNLDDALFQYQEHEFRKLFGQHQYVLEQSEWIPSVAEEMSEVLRVGVTASYSRPPPASPRRRCLPYRSKDTIEIMQKLWQDIKKGRMFGCGSNSVGGDDAQIEATPSTLVLRRNPERSRSAGERAIAELRRINSYFDERGNYPVELLTTQEMARE